MERSPARLEIEDVGGTGIGGPDEDEDAGADRGRLLDQRLERVGAEQRVEGDRVGAEPGIGPQGVSVCPKSASA